MKPYYQHNGITVYHSDFRNIIDALPVGGLVITDPPYNIGFNYDIYGDNLPDHEYIEMLCELQRFEKVVIIHYPEEMQRFVVPAMGPPDHSGVWCYNLNTPRRFRLINYYGCLPDYSRIKQPYKNLDDKRIKNMVANGSDGTSLYEWWDDIQIVKNVSDEKAGHPCPIPERLAKRIITLTANSGDVIIDPFAGGLTVAKAAIDLGYRFIGTELSKAYIRDGINRLAQPALFGELTP